MLVAGAALLAFGFTKVPDKRPAPRLGRSAPVRVEVGGAKINAAVMAVGERSDGGLAVPPLSRSQTAGWYRRGPSPGEPGSAVIVGHYDSRTGPAAFYRLDKVEEGDDIKVVRRDGTVAVFEADRVQHVAKTAFPRARVLAAVRDAELRLITCGGRFDFTKHSYTDNLIVYAHLVSAKRPT